MEAKILSVNCQGLRSNEKRLDVFDFLKGKNCHVYCLQETHFTSDIEKFIRTQWGAECLFSSGTSNSRGVAIMFSKNIEFSINDHVKSPDGNFLIADVTLQNNRITLINTYGPNNDSPDYFENIISLAHTFKNDKIIWCGDFNVVQNPSIDCYNYTQINNRKAMEKVLEIKESYCLFDPYRESHPNAKRYTWRKKRPLKQARLDYFLVSENLLSSVENSKIEASYRSDHSAIILELQFTQFNHGKSLWKFNNSLLQDKQYLETINEKIDEIRQQYAIPVYNFDKISEISDTDIQFTISDQLFLDTLLMEIRGKSISYSAYKKKEEEKEEIILIRSISEIEKKLTLDNQEQLETLQDSLQKIRKHKMQGYLIRSRANIIENDEKPSKYFCNLEKNNYTSKIIPKIEKDDGTIISDQREILDETKAFYQNLYSDRDHNLLDINLEDEMQNLNTPKLSNTESKSLEGNISIKEASIALKAMKNNRSPGSDGFSADFFKVFWGKIGHFVVRALNFGYSSGELSSTQRQGVVICIPKENKSRNNLKNYRPISLLNCVYKIASSVITNRIKQFLPKLINDDQTGFLAGRYLGENTRQIYDIMHYIEENNIAGLLLLVDFEKAFDSLSWNFIHKVLTFFNFGESIRKWISIFYKNAQLCINIGGNLSPFFQIQRGCRQGDPISPYIFILCAEILATKIRNNNNIKGIKIGNTEYKFSQYADDSSVLLDGSSKSLNETLKELADFAQYSGLNVNFDKTQVVWLGIKKYSSDTINTRWKLKWGISNFKLLGINFDVDVEKMNKINYESKIDKLKSLITFWKRRYLTPLGKITVIKSILLPIFNHLFLALPNPDEKTIKHINNLLYNFLWEGPAKIKNSVCVKEYYEGGLKMINLVAFIKSLKITWMRRLILSPGKWANITEQYFKPQNILQFGSMYTKMQITKVSNKFWKDVLEAYQNLIEKLEPSKSEELLSMPIFYNECFNIDMNNTNFKNWPSKTVTWLNDLVTENGSFLNEQDLENMFDIKTNYLELHGLLSAIKKYMRTRQIHLSNKIQSPTLPFHIATIIKSKKGTNDLYTLLNQNDSVPTAQIKWQQLYDIDDSTWAEIFNSPFNITKSTALQWLQVRINHNILPTKNYLFKIKATNSPLCNDCEADETISHMFWHCRETQKFLKQVKHLLNQNGIQYDLNETSFLFNVNTGIFHESDLIFNLKLKEYIFTSKFHKKPLYISAAINRFIYYYKSLEYLNRKNNKCNMFNKQWENYKTIIE